MIQKILRHKQDFSQYKRLHLIGVGGSGMSSLAQLLLAEGKVITGSDLKMSPVAEQLASRGVKIFVGQGVDMIPEKVDAIVYSAAIPELDPIFFKAIKKKQIPLFEYHEAVGAYANGKHVVAIAGTHGKTTTTAMIAAITRRAGLSASALVGGVMADTGSGVEVGTSDIFIVEADEYQSGFLHLTPSVLVITNIDHDHVNYFPDFTSVQRVFKKLVRRVEKTGVIVCDPSDPHVVPVLDGAVQPVVDYTSVSLEGVSLRLFGDHNRKNAQCALAVAGVLGVSLPDAHEALRTFSGTGRRFEYKGTTASGAVVYDDYAHNPQKVAAAIAGAREAFPDKRLTVIFQPHLYSRTKEFLQEFAVSVAAADKIFVTDIYAAREKPDLSISAQDVVRAAKQYNRDTVYAPDVAALVSELLGNVSNADVVMTIGAGDVYRIADMLVHIPV